MKYAMMITIWLVIVMQIMLKHDIGKLQDDIAIYANDRAVEEAETEKQVKALKAELAKKMDTPTVEEIDINKLTISEKEQ